MRDVRMRGFRDRTPVARALALLAERISPLPEVVPIDRAAGRVAAAPVVARTAVPHFARAAMDGYALTAASTAPAAPAPPSSLFVIGDVRAGRGALHPSPGRAVRITTGAPVPEGADAV
ncbi:MAG: hypothetical protein R3B70_33270 [Polyangiaceae bacterium]